MHMRTTLHIDQKLITQASALTNISEKTELVRLGLLALINLEAQKRLAKLGGTKKINKVNRR
jgi:hypothetical protein